MSMNKNRLRIMQEIFPFENPEVLNQKLAQFGWNIDETVNGLKRELSYREKISENEKMRRISTRKESRMNSTIAISPISSSRNDFGFHTMNIRDQNKEITLDICLRVCAKDTQLLYLLKGLEQILSDCGAESKTCLEQIFVHQAAYEDVQLKFRGQVLLNGWKNGREAVGGLAVNFCKFSGVGLHTQPYLDIVDLTRHFDCIHSVHDSIDVVFLALGNMPNAGTFLARGSYSPLENRDRLYSEHKWTSFAVLEHDRRLLSVFFSVNDDNQVAGKIGYKLVVSYSAFHSVVIDCGSSWSGEKRHFFIRMHHPPQLWKAIPFVSKTTKVSHVNISKCKEWSRCVSWQKAKSQGMGCTAQTLGESPVLCIGIPKQTEMNQHDSKREIYPHSPTVKLFEIVSRWKSRANVHTEFAAVKKFLDKTQPVRSLMPNLGTFSATYSLQALLGRGSIVTDQLESFGHGKNPPLLLRRINWCLRESIQSTENALEKLLSAVDEKRPLSLLATFEHLYAHRLDEPTDHLDDLPANCVLVGKVMITPTRSLLLSPQVQMSNRVIRQFGQQNALRCFFRDENGSKLQPGDMNRGRCLENRSTLVKELVTETLNRGLLVAGRRFHFLAWSNSQMRDHGCYLYSQPRCPAPSSGPVTKGDDGINRIRTWMGDFTDCKTVPKLMSRMGQCFTQAMNCMEMSRIFPRIQPTILLASKDWRVDADIVGGYLNPETEEQYTFSDGVGRISVEKAAEIAHALQLVPVPSCFQFRFKGFKGVLSVDPQLDADGQEGVVFRKSQKKFDDPADSSQVLEIVKYSKPCPVVLNRPLIMIFDQVSEKQGHNVWERISNRVHRLFENEINTMADMLCYEDAALEALQSRLSTPIDFKHLRNNGFQLTTEPFFRSLLLAIHRCNISQQLHKTKVPVPDHLGRTLFGVLDETGLLQYGQVFLQVSPDAKKQTLAAKCITGKVIMTKNPCLVAGDVRLFDAVFIKELSHLTDVIVFPQNGPRPHPDEMAGVQLVNCTKVLHGVERLVTINRCRSVSVRFSPFPGSDLDGDEYTVLWDQELVFTSNETPMDFPKTTVVVEPKLPTVR